MEGDTQEAHMLIDSTLREGAQAYGVYLSRGAKRRVVELLAQAGVDEIECGWAGQEDLPELLAWAREALPAGEAASPALSLWCPCREADVREAASLAAAGLLDRLNIGAPSSSGHREKRLGLSLAEMAARVQSVVRAAKALGVPYVSVGLEDISRADEGEALLLARAAVDAGADRVRLSDTVGLLTPLATAALVRRFVDTLPVPVALHAHNDLGLATANAVTALQSGAAFVDVAVLGLGERAGIASLEEVAAWAALRAGGQYDLRLLRALSLLVSHAAKLPLARNRAVVGEDIFSSESGLHVHGLLRDPALFEPFDPEAVGATRRVGVGAKSGGAAVNAAVNAALGRLAGQNGQPGGQSGKQAGEQACGGADAGLLARVRALAARLGRPLTDKELLKVL